MFPRSNQNGSVDKEFVLDMAQEHLLCYIRDMIKGATRGWAFGAFVQPKIFKTSYSNFEMCRNFQIINLKFYILIMFKKSFT